MLPPFPTSRYDYHPDYNSKHAWTSTPFRTAQRCEQNGSQIKRRDKEECHKGHCPLALSHPSECTKDVPVLCNSASLNALSISGHTLLLGVFRTVLLDCKCQFGARSDFLVLSTKQLNGGVHLLMCFFQRPPDGRRLSGNLHIRCLLG